MITRLRREVGEDVVSLRGAIRPVRAGREEIKESSERLEVPTMLFSVSEKEVREQEVTQGPAVRHLR